MNKVKAKKIGSGNVFLRGVVIFDQHANGQINQFTGVNEFNIGVKIMNDDDLSNKSLVDFVKMMGLSQNDINKMFVHDDEGTTFFSKSRKPISVIDLDSQIMEIDNLVGCKVVVALNVTIWQYGNTINTGIYCNGIKVLQKAETQTIFDIFANEQSKIYDNDTKAIENKTVATEIGNLSDYENIIADNKNIPF